MANPYELLQKGYWLIPVNDGNLGDPSLPQEKRVKTPLTRHAARDASNDPLQIRQWAEKYPGCNWGIVCKNILVFDLDRKIDGRTLSDEEFISAWEDLTGDFPSLHYPIVKTASGGRHYYFRKPDVELTSTKKFSYTRNGKVIKTNIDVQVGNVYVVAPGSKNYDGGEYTTDEIWDVADLPEIPPEVLALLPRKEKGTQSALPPVNTSSIPFSRKSYLCQRYVDQIESDVEGSGGGKTFWVASVIFWCFDLSKEEGWPIFRSFTDRCQTAWTNERELEHKYRDAVSKPLNKYERGCFLKKFEQYTDNEILSGSIDDLIDRLTADTKNDFPCDGDEDKRAFPLEYFPPEIRDYCREVARALCVHESLPGYLALSVTSAANGYRSTFSHADFSHVRALFHTFLVLYSGGGKSPTMDAMLFPIVEENQRSERQRIFEEKNYRRKKREKKRNDPEPEEPKFIPRQIVQGTTSEAIEKYWSDLEQSLIITKDDIDVVASLGEEIHKKIAALKTGVLWWYDEGSVLLQGMDAYKKAQTDQSVYLQLLEGRGGGALRVDRESNRSYFDSHTVLVAGIQDEVLQSIAKDDTLYFKKGFFQRINFAFPPFVELEIDPPMINEETKQRYRDKIIWLYSETRPYHDYTLSPEAAEMYRKFKTEVSEDYNMRGKLGRRKTAADSAIMSTDQKNKKRVLEVALLLEVMEQSGKDSIDKFISARSMEGAIKIIQYCDEDFQKVVRRCCYSEGTPEGTLEDKIMRALEKAAEDGLSVRELRQKVFHKHTARDIVSFMSRLTKKRKTIKMREIKKERGRPVRKYFFAPKEEPTIVAEPDEEEYFSYEEVEEEEPELVSG